MLLLFLLVLWFLIIFFFSLVTVMHVIHLSYFNFNKLKLIFLSFHLKFLILDVYFIVFQIHLFLTLKTLKSLGKWSKIICAI